MIRIRLPVCIHPVNQRTDGMTRGCCIHRERRPIGNRRRCKRDRRGRRPRRIVRAPRLDRDRGRRRIGRHIQSALADRSQSRAPAVHVIHRPGDPLVVTARTAHGSGELFAIAGSERYAFGSHRNHRHSPGWRRLLRLCCVFDLRTALPQAKSQKRRTHQQPRERFLGCVVALDDGANCDPCRCGHLTLPCITAFSLMV